jgi:hypothetical protein
LKELFDYGQDGFLVWKERDDKPKSWNSKYAGSVAGSYKFCGSSGRFKYRISINDVAYSGKCLVWIFFNGGIPSGCEVRMIDWLTAPKIENLICHARAGAKQASIKRYTEGVSTGVNKRNGSSFYTCKEPVTHKYVLFTDEKSAYIHFDNLYEDLYGIRINGTNREDVLNKIVNRSKVTHLRNQKRNLVKNGHVGVSAHNGKFRTYFLGKYHSTHDTFQQAARAYNIAAYEYYGQHAVLNEIPDPLGVGF